MGNPKSYSIRLLRLSLLFSLFFFLGACKKKTAESFLLITVTYDDKFALPNVNVYMKSGTRSNPGIPPSQYDQVVTTDANGMVQFSGLPADDYYFYTEAVVSGKTVQGVGMLTIVAKSAPNRYEMRIKAS